MLNFAGLKVKDFKVLNVFKLIILSIKRSKSKETLFQSTVYRMDKHSSKMSLLKKDLTMAPRRSA